MPRVRPRRRCRLFRRSLAKYYFLFLIVGFITTFITFSFTVYVNSNYLLDLTDYIFSVQFHKAAELSLLSRVGENYQARDFNGKSQSVNYDYYIKYKDFDFRTPESLTYKNRTYSDAVEVLYRFPERTPLAALLLIFHGCQDSAPNWFHTPERQRIIGAAVDLGYGCLVFQASDKTSRCWANDADIYENKDVQMVFEGLKGFYKDYPALEPLPRFTFGSSSGGIFSSIFALNQKYEIRGQILFASIILPEVLHTHITLDSYPSTVWIHMLRDIEFASEDRINVSKRIFTQHKIPHSAFPIEPVYLTHSTFHDRIPTVTSETSRFLLYRLQQNRWVNMFNYLVHNPRRKQTWREFLFPSSAPPKSEEMFDNLNQNQNIISELMNTIYGEHEISFERSFEALTWLRQTYLTATNRTDWKT